MATAAESKYRQILGVRFFTGSAAEAVQIGLRGGLVVVPAAPALVEIESDPGYRDALLHADLALTDSGFMVLVWNLIKFEKITRTSGLEYLKLLIEEPAFRESKSILWIMPSEQARDKNIAWLHARGLRVTENDCYIAPQYESNAVTDSKLLALLSVNRPAQVVIALGGGIQEKLGDSIKQSAGYNPGIHCIGAAIGFLSGDQINIPDWADRLFLGWIFRCFSQPTKFIPRYWRAFRLLPMLIKYRERLPEMRRLAKR
jgi:N-acetylglucosaminyldiphosphoundecaprenol N-acetyl-beta-D-mannosaminyltransferase